MIFKRRLKYSLNLFFPIFFCFCSREKFGTFEELKIPTQKGYFDLQHGYELTQEKLRFFIRESQNERDLLVFSLKKAFLRARKAEDEVKYRLASFKMNEKEIRDCENQSMDSMENTGKALLIKGRLFSKACTTDYTLEITIEKSKNFLFQIKLTNPELNRLHLQYQQDPQEKILGGGEQFTHLNLKGHRIPILTEEQGVGRGAQPITLGANLMAGAGGNEYTTYAPIPFFMSSQYYAIHLLNSEYSIFDFRKENTEISLWAKEMKFRVYYGKSYQELIEKFTEDQGRFPPLPEWTYGTILGMQGGKKRVEEVLEESLAHKNPVTAIWIQDWVGRRKTSFGSQLWWRWYPDEKAYPNFKEWTQSLKKRGIHVLGYINPFLANEGPLYEEAIKKDLLVKKPDGSIYVIQTAGFPAVLLDLTNPQAQSWIKEIIKKNLIGNGLSGWMADFGEWLPWDAKLYSGIPAPKYHNLYPVDWVRLNREAIREAKKEGEVFVFVRAGFTGSAKYAISFWLGDQLVTFDEYDGLGSAITGLITGGLSGIAINHSDIGGYTTINNPIKNYHRSEKLLIRWMEFEALTPIYRTHEGNRPEQNAQFYDSDYTQSVFARYGRLHKALAPYFKVFVEEASKTGMPVVRALPLHYPNDEESYKARHQFLVGEDLLVAPGINPSDKKFAVYIPEGLWIHAWDFRLKVNRPGYYEFYPPAVFFKAGGKHEGFLRKVFDEYNKAEKIGEYAEKNPSSS